MNLMPINAQVAPIPTPTWQWEQMLAPFLAAHDVSELSKETYEYNLRASFFPWLKGHNITAPRREDILAYKQELLANGLAANTVSTYLSAVRQFFSWLEGAVGYPNVARSVKSPRRPKGFRRDALTLDQTVELLASVDRSNLEGLRNFAMLNLMVRTGVRSKEVIWADVGDIAQNSGEMVLWVLGKARGEKDEFVLLTESCYRPIMTYLAARGVRSSDEPLFTSCSRRNYGDRLTTGTIRYIAKAHLRGIDLDSPRLSCHSFRHSAVTYGFMSGAKPEEVQQMARHSSILTTLGYNHHLQRIEQAAERKVDELLRTVLSKT